MEVSTYGALHAGDVVLGVDDGLPWKVAQVIKVGALEIVLTRPDVEVKGCPPPDAPVTVVQRSDISAEYAAAGVLIAGFGAVELLGERWS
jgi:hypothetical protein